LSALREASTLPSGASTTRPLAPMPLRLIAASFFATFPGTGRTVGVGLGAGAVPVTAGSADGPPAAA
jgi:hypothetical protein